MEYSDSSRRLNLLSGIVFGTLLGAGLALLLVPGDGVGEKARVVVRGVRRVGRGARRTHAWAKTLRAATDASSTDEPADDDDDISAPRGARGGGMARRRFEL
ncbi:MAG TPA: hypothetical protein VJT67_06765 [Longimicrobiaceae bacterium]|nr:hypothetical protein [Longimicrobiaceae bacterium]